MLNESTASSQYSMNSKLTRRDFIKYTGTAATLAAATPAWAQAGKVMTVAFVGVAHIHTPGYLNALKKRSDVRIKYIWDHEPERAARRAKEVDAQVATDLNSIWSDPEIAAVIVLSETNRHHELVRAAATAGKHLFVEKPLGITAAESREMAAEIEKRELVFATGYFMRTDPKHLFVRNEIAKGNFGTITRVRGSICHNGSLGGWFDTEWRWMADPKLAGVGAFGDLGTHKLDLLLWLCGGLDSVTAAIQPVTHRYGDCDETGEALLRFQNGVIGTLAAGWVDIEDPVQLLISGTAGHAVIINGQLFYRSEKAAGSDARKPWTDLPPALPLPIDQFIAAVGGGPRGTLVTSTEAAARVVAMEAIYKAARERKWVKVA